MARNSPPSLAGLCSVTIVRFLDESMVPLHCSTLYKPHHYYPREVNPFSCFPPGIVEELVNELYKITEPTVVQPDKRQGISWKLHPLLLSGRIENLTVYIIDNFVDALNILTMVIGNAHKLKSLRLEGNNLIKTPWWTDCSPPCYYKVKQKINLLASAAVNLECLYIGEDFISRNLEKLKTSRTLKLSRYSFSSGDVFSERLKCRISYDTPFLLSTLPQLRTVNWDVAEPLEIIHGKERISEISKAYELREACLLAPSEKQVDIFIRTCPHIENLIIVVDKLERMEHYNSLIKLKNITRVTIKVKKTSELKRSRDHPVHYLVRYHQQQMLENERMSALVSALSRLKGDRLKTLKLEFSITDLDVQLLSSLCPNLQELQLKCYSDVQPSKPLQTCFPQLKQLHVMFNWNYASNICTDTLLLLTSSPALRTLYLENASRLHDKVMSDILQRNPMSCLESLFLERCSLTHHGLLKVIRQCSNLTKLTCKYVRRLDIPKEALTEMAQDINPQLRITF